MCTVTFIHFNKTFFITSNRDESPGRNAKGLISNHFPGKVGIHYPLDEESGGSWIAMSDSGKVACLLNGAFEPFIPELSYRQSRGQVVVDAITEPDVKRFIETYPLDGIAPFTLLIFENGNFVQLAWDGTNKHIQPLSVTEPQIWSSVTLYPPHVRAWRKALFEKWIAQTEIFDRDSIIDFHQIANGDPDNDFIMNRNEIVKTLSITSIELKPESGSLLHFALDKNLREEILVKYE
ncbi:MAG TPA: NRDE family protein [Saprospiraceae bacterium]|nr:NRDE family protein [Saprospiraceae bacterium]